MFAGAGGFGSTQGGFGADSSPKKVRQEEKLTCLPVTIRAIESALAERDDDSKELLFYGSEPGMLLLVGSVETITKSTASLELQLNDATGRIKVRHFFTDAPPKDIDAFGPGRYVCIHGSVRTVPVVHFAALSMQLVRSADEVSYHLIESAHAALKLKKGLPVAAMALTPEPKKTQPGAMTAANEGAAPMDISPPKEPEPSAQGALLSAPPMAVAAPAAVAPATALKGGVGLKDALKEAVQKGGEGKEEGMSLDELTGLFSSVGAEEVRSAVRALVDDGDIFETIDDTHFQIV